MSPGVPLSGSQFLSPSLMSGNLVIIIKILNIIFGRTDSLPCPARPGMPEYRGPQALKLLIGEMFVSDNIFVTWAVFYDAVSSVICEQGGI